MTHTTTEAALSTLVEMSRWVGEPARDLVTPAEGTSLKGADEQRP